MRIPSFLLGAALAATSMPSAAQAQPSPSAPRPTLAEKTAGMDKFEGFIPFYWEASTGKIWLELSRFDEDLLYISSLATGLGSNPVGLDRSQIGDGRVARFERTGPRVFLVQPNLRYRAVGAEEAERRAVAESFAQSTLWGAEIAAESDGRVLVDATDFLLRDAVDVAGRLQRSGQGSFALDRGRSRIHLERTRGFPDNTEFEAALTFSSSDPGRLVSEVTPTPEAVTVRLHHSWVRLPDLDYSPRPFDPRNSSYGITYADYAAPIDAPLEKRFLARHRLKKRDPGAAVSEAVEPIVYYLDRGAPEPVRTALLEGARWWNQAFEAAGYRDAFQVALLPEGADPLDVRYNVIQWVHRSTRGWSYGSSVVDPRTGEIIKGHVLLGSLRVRQDRLILEGLGPTFNGAAENCAVGGGAETGWLAAFDPRVKPVETALARIRQLAAHEVGHTLGFAHNFAASVNDRASVMDYPAPLAKVTDEGNLDLSDAYAVGIGEWDKVAVRYAYQEFPPDVDEAAALDATLQEAFDRGLLFATDADARPPGAAHPFANLWDNGSDPVQALRDALRVRRVALDRFGENNIPLGAPLSELENTLVPIYLYHRYQTVATAKMLGGLVYHYKLRGDSLPIQSIVPADRQREALEAVLETLRPEELALPEKILGLLHPQAFGYGDRRERFPSRTGPVFDPLSAAANAADLAVSALLQPERAARLELFHARNPDLPDFGETLDRLLGATWMADQSLPPLQQAVRRVVQRTALDRLIELAGDVSADGEVRAVASAKLAELGDFLAARNPGGVQAAHELLARRTIESFLGRPFPPRKTPEVAPPPPGEPIG